MSEGRGNPPDSGAQQGGDASPLPEQRRSGDIEAPDNFRLGPVGIWNEVSPPIPATSTRALSAQAMMDTSSRSSFLRRSSSVLSKASTTHSVPPSPILTAMTPPLKPMQASSFNSTEITPRSSTDIATLLFDPPPPSHASPYTPSLVSHTPTAASSPSTRSMSSRASLAPTASFRNVPPHHELQAVSHEHAIASKQATLAYESSQHQQDVIYLQQLGETLKTIEALETKEYQHAQVAYAEYQHHYDAATKYRAEISKIRDSQQVKQRAIAERIKRIDFLKGELEILEKVSPVEHALLRRQQVPNAHIDSIYTLLNKQYGHVQTRWGGSKFNTTTTDGKKKYIEHMFRTKPRVLTH